ncbi:hypothetical protein [Aureicoccus marinus]|nr:hypothetical protein [Aureicoccus marinus]
MQEAEQDIKQKDVPIKFKWKPIYFWVLLANTAYILIFYLIMTSNR